MFKKLLIVLSVLISSCGGSSSPTINLPQPPVSIPTTPEIAAPIYPPNLSNTTCDGLDFISILSAQSDSQTNTGFEVTKTIDQSLNNENRWEANEQNAQITLELGLRYLVKEVATAWFEGDTNKNSFDILVSEDGISFSTILTSELSSGNTNSFERFDIPDTVARFVRVISNGRDNGAISSLNEIGVFGCPLDVDTLPVQDQTVNLVQYNLNPQSPPGSNFDLLSWALDTPRFDPDDGFAARASERDLDQGFTDSDFFYTAEDGGMVFKATIFGATTSANSRFTRTELREMLRRGNTNIRTQGVNQNNWILDYQPIPSSTVGGKGGILKATLKVEKVTQTGSQSHIGRIVIGQIHASQDEPIRLYFKKFPDNERGYIYFAHEIRDSDDIWKMVVGPLHTIEDDQPIYLNNPEQGIALNEIFSYEIEQTGARIDVIIRRGDLDGPIIGHQYVDMNSENSGYDIIEEWNYFKAGLYSQNNTGNRGDANGVGSDYDQVTFYYLSNVHSTVN